MSESRLLVVSDVHGRLPALRWVLKNETADAMFFLGDGLYDLDGAVNLLPRPLPYPVYRARGNCDIGYQDPDEGLAPFGGVLFFYTHGHLYGVKTGPDRVAEAGQNRGADVVLYGHTHRQRLVPALAGMPAVFNPGSLRDTGSYGVVEVEDGRCQFGWKRVPESL